MAKDFVSALRDTINNFGDPTPELRAKVYDKARSTIAKKIAEREPPLSPSEAERQKRGLEDAISRLEREYAKSVPETDPLAELEHIFSSIDRNKNQSNHTKQPVKAEPAWPAPPASKAEPYKPPPPAPEPDISRPASPAAEVEPNWQKPVPVQPAPEFDDRAQPGMDVGQDDEHADVFASDEEAAAADTFQRLRPAERKRSYGGLIAAAVALLVIAGGGYGIWLNKDAFGKMLGLGGSKVATTEPVKSTPAKPASDAAATPPAPAASGAEPEGTPKFTQRLTPQGSEVDPGPAGGQSGVGEGESVAALTTPPSATTTPALSAPAGGTPAAGAPAGTTPPAPGAAPAAPPANGTAPAAPADNAATPPSPAGAPTQTSLPVGQKAIFYEERTSTAQGSAEPGNIVWSLVQESPGGDLPPEPAIRAEATIPGKDIQLRMTIRRNTDQTLPASHIIEMIFLTPDGFEGGGVDNILRVAMKSSEQDAGSPLIGIPAKIADGFFLVALNDTKADEDANLTLLRGQDWIDVPVVYKTGRRALLTMEKGIPGEKVFDEAIKAWQAKTAG
ncbi:MULTISPECIES: hypothetical protein [unclassified Mesorhizobium]|uniref:hypothetical protein n=1 Tax=unclassified Mesorhizobium TaxID=325217 RepID=UPI00112CA766|nr:MULTISPECIES: hypothetical protein [unclassified Mesorhizobium]TPI50447.1 hypothetical protein FJW11_24190 [Mesorhizobium sp. B3-1-1]TPJ68524.1 hypothetical protein FJ462_12515 [Mesorhizobium sp. B2-6-7]TPJ78682.1 hypothetical protein FJ422_26605 [Mesorhizobium sp. B2-6-3]TPJ95515.1 hypothetical protein FJ491_23415 [Mesorhizobium sp. B2-5-10]TPK12059.1 hypothetical protein FJ490_07460 [Mesorhizobium sp. B2-5-11]